MRLIRKFVVGTGLAAGVFAFTAIALPVQAREASGAAPVANQFTPSAACTSAINGLKAAAAADRTEDIAEWHIAKAEGVSATDASEDAAEHANFRALWTSVRSACAITVATVKAKTFTPSAECTAAIQAFKAAWAQGRPTTLAQWQQLEALGRAARLACGWTWGFRH